MTSLGLQVLHARGPASCSQPVAWVLDRHPHPHRREHLHCTFRGVGRYSCLYPRVFWTAPSPKYYCPSISFDGLFSPFFFSHSFPFHTALCNFLLLCVCLGIISLQSKSCISLSRSPVALQPSLPLYPTRSTHHFGRDLHILQHNILQTSHYITIPQQSLD